MYLMKPIVLLPGRRIMDALDLSRIKQLNSVIATLLICAIVSKRLVLVKAHQNNIVSSAPAASKSTSESNPSGVRGNRDLDGGNGYKKTSSDIEGTLSNLDNHPSIDQWYSQQDGYRQRLEEEDDNQNMQRDIQMQYDPFDNQGDNEQEKYPSLALFESLSETLERSLEQKHHILWQLNELHERHNQHHNTESKHLQSSHDSSHFHKQKPAIKLTGKIEFSTIHKKEVDEQLEGTLQLQRDLVELKNQIQDQLQTHPSKQYLNQHQNQQTMLAHRVLEDAFEDLYTSTYGTTMFCGASWAEASTSCESRQNCPSGQTDECIIPGQQCWAFTECDTRRGDGAQFSAMHGVTGGENLQGTGVGAEAAGGFVDLSKPSPEKSDHYFCGKGYEDAISQCASHCPSGSLNDCPLGEICFFDTPCDARLMTRAPSPPSPTTSPTTPAPVVYASKLNKYFCGYDWNDAQTRCEIWCPSGSDDDCPDDLLCFAFTKCHAVDMNGVTMKQMEKQKQQAADQNQGSSGGGGVGGVSGGGGGGVFTPSPTRADSVPGYYDVMLGGSTRPTREPTNRPTPKPIITAEMEMHRYSFCGAFWVDARDNCDTKPHCEDDRDCPENEFCWTQTPCDYFATQPPTHAPTKSPTGGPTGSPTTPGPTVKPKPSQSPTPAPTRSPSVEPTGTPTDEPTITPKPTDVPTPAPISKKDPGFSFFCGTSWSQADETCSVRCRSGNSLDCPGKLECWAFTSCEEERGYTTPEPTDIPTGTPVMLYVPGFGGAQVPVFGGQDFSQFEPTISPAPTTTSSPSVTPTLPPGTVSKEILATYYCGTDWNDVEQNCHQPCPSGESVECEDPAHSCWAFVTVCRERTQKPTSSPTTATPTRSPVTNPPTRDPSAPTTPHPTDHPTDLYGLLEGQKDRFYCASTWDGIICGVSTPCPSGNDDTCAPGESCFASTIGCSAPQPIPTDPPTYDPTQSPMDSSPQASPIDPIPPASPSDQIDNSGEDWDSQSNVDNQGEDWGSPNDVDNEGEDWGGQDETVDNEGENWGNTPEPTQKPIQKEPTLKPTPDPTIDLLTHLENLKTTYFCAEDWDKIDCENARACPSGNSKDCPKKQQCFSGTPCKGKNEASGDGKGDGGGSSDKAEGAPSPASRPSTYCTPTPLFDCDEEESGNLNANPTASSDSKTKPPVNEVTSKYFCGTSWGEMVENCDNATPCPSGTSAECEMGENCFANTPCGESSSSEQPLLPASSSHNFVAMMGDIPEYCKDKMTMSRNVGYWQSWSIYRDDSCNPFTAETIDASSYTHVIFSFAEISSSGTLAAWDIDADIKGGQYKQFIDVKKRFAGTKVMVAVGGWTHNDPDNERRYRFSKASATPKARMTFAQSAVSFLRKYQFDGLDLDWEYPADENRGGDPELDKENYALLCQELRKYFDQAAEKFELTMAIPVSIYRYEMGFDLENIAKSLNFFNIMAYDLHGIWDDPPIVGAHSDLRKIDEAIEYMITNSSVPPSKIVLGLPAYGRSYTMSDTKCVEIGCEFREDSNETAVGGCLDTKGFVPYVEIYHWTEEGKGKGYDSITVDNTTSSAVMVKDGNQLISYDNLESFKLKVDYATNKCLGGSMVWAVDMMPLGTQGSGSGGSSDGSGGTEGQSILSDEEGIQAFCGETWDKAMECKSPCPSGLSDDCAQGETCFAGVPCGEGGGRPVGETCKVCPDTTTQGLRSWVEVEVDINGDMTSTTCGELDYGPLQFISKNSETCDAVQVALANECCYDYPNDPCLLCRKDMVYYTVRTELEVSMPDGSPVTCGLAKQMLAPEEDGSELCVTTRDSLFDSCCYRQCQLCAGQALKWWVEFEEPTSDERYLQEDEESENSNGEDELQGEGETEAEEVIEEEDQPLTCSSIDAALYTGFVEDDTENCTETKSTYSSECCYDFPTYPCGVCKKGDTSFTLLWANEVEYDGKTVTCGVLDNILNTEEESSPLCESTISAHFDDCCFDKCSLCGEQQLAWDYILAYDDETNKTCGEIVATFAADEINSNSDECSSAKEEFGELCCYTMPTNPCELCPEFVRWKQSVEFNGEKSTCKEATELLKREEADGEECLAASEDIQESCCYELCDICGESLMLDWDAVVEYEGSELACGDFKPLFGKNEIEAGTDSCTNFTQTYQDLCCYTPPAIPCNLCQTDSDFLDAYSSVEIEFWGSLTNCSKVYDYLIRRIESDSETCSSAKDTLTADCCYHRCSVCGEGELQDFNEMIDFDGETISCLQLHTVRTLDVSADSEHCLSMRTQYSESCCYEAPETPCVLCTAGSVRKDVEVDFRGKTETCENVANHLASRTNNGTDECASTQAEFSQYCCFDKCSLCMANEQIDWDAYVDFDFEGKPQMSCGSFDWYFTSNAVEEGTPHCTDLQNSFSATCCYVPIDFSIPSCALCKQGDNWYDQIGDATVTFEGELRTCTEVSNSLFRKVEDDSATCNAAKIQLFSACCFERCSLCGDAQLDANVEVMYNEVATTCLELGLKFAADVIQEGSEECNSAKELLFGPCCYVNPVDPCVLCRTDIGQGEVRENVDISFYGSSTTCKDLNSFLVSREEQVGFMCQAAKTELQSTCCLELCTICGSGGNLYWDNPVTFNNMTFACGELTWVLSGRSVEEGSEECYDTQSTYYESCCTGPSPDLPTGGDKCEICPSGKDWYAMVVYNGKTMTCLELDAALLQNGVFDLSVECSQAMVQYSGQCCYTPPTKPCAMCTLGQQLFSIRDQNITYNGAPTSCFGVHNYLATRVNSEDSICTQTQQDLFDLCCFDKCSLCQDYQLDKAAVVVHDGTSVGCSEIENNYFTLNQVLQGSEQCISTQQQYFDNCCYDIPCDLCMSGDSRYELMLDEKVTFMGSERSCSDVSVLLDEGFLSQSDACKTTKSDLFSKCCYKQCSLCEDHGWAVDWNRPITYEGAPSSCLGVYTKLRNERVQDGDDLCVNIKYTVSHECCYKMPANQCVLCQNSEGNFLNTNWNYEVFYQGATLTCGDINAMLSSEELDGVLCLAARDELWNKCCVPQLGGSSDVQVVPTSPPEESDATANWSPTSAYYDENDFTNFYKRPSGGRKLQSWSMFGIFTISFALFYSYL